jgi:hypothetical protein
MQKLFRNSHDVNPNKQQQNHVLGRRTTSLLLGLTANLSFYFLLTKVKFLMLSLGLLVSIFP